MAQDSQILDLEELPADPPGPAPAAMRALIRGWFTQVHAGRKQIEADTGKPSLLCEVSNRRLLLAWHVHRAWAPEPAMSGCSAGSPGEAARFGELPGNGVRNLTPQFIGLARGHAGVDPAFDLDPEGPPGPACPCVSVYPPRNRPGRRFGGVDDFGVDAVGQAADDFAGDLVADMADERGDREPGCR